MLLAHLPPKISTTGHHLLRVFHSNSTRRAPLAARSTVARAQASMAMSVRKEASIRKAYRLAMAETYNRREVGGRHLGRVALRGSHHCWKVRTLTVGCGRVPHRDFA